MKSKLLLILMVFMAMQLQAQYYCPFNYYVTPGTTDVSFSPNSYYSGGQYHFTWTFGDTATSTLANPLHAYSASHTYYVQCFVYDAINNPVCSTGDSIYLSAPYSCGFRVMQLFTGDSLAYATQPLSGAHIEWDFGDGSGVFTSNPIIHSYTHVGIYNCTCYQKDSLGNIMCQQTEVMTVHSTHGCTFNYSVNSTNQSAIDLTASTPAGYNVDWSFGDNTTGSGTQVTHAYNSGGTYNVCFVAYDSLGDSCATCNLVQVPFSNSNCFFVSVPDPADPFTVTFTDTTAGGNQNIVWYYGDQSGDSGFGVTATHTYFMAGAYSVCMNEWDSLGNISCQRCDSIYVGATNCNFISTPTILDPLTIDFAANSSAYLVNWNFGDGTSGTGANTSHTYSGNGSYQACMNETDSLTGNIICQACSWIQIFSPSSACQASFFATNQGLAAYFIDLSIADSSTISNYTWDFGDGATSNLRFPQHVYQSPGNYNACLVINTANCTDTFCNAVVVDTNTIINPVCNAFYAIVQIAPYQVTVVNLSGGNALSYIWDYGDGNSDTLAYPTHFYSTTGSYNLCLTVDDGNGCNSTYCDTLNVDSLGNIFHIAQQGFTLIVTSPSQITSAVTEISSAMQFNVFPNPFETELFLVSSADTKMESYRILSLQGSLVISGNSDISNQRINTQDLSTGTYLLEVIMKDGSRFYKAIIRK